MKPPRLTQRNFAFKLNYSTKVQKIYISEIKILIKFDTILVLDF